jgi:hypothetical protein
VRRNLAKKISLLFIFALNFLLFSPAHAANYTSPQTLSDHQITAGDIAKYRIVVPHDLDPGYHKMTIQIYDGAGVLQERVIEFCKAADGRAHWDNKCPGMDPVASLATLEKITVREELPKYIAPMEPKKQVNNIVAGLAILTLMVAGKDTLTQQASKKNEEDHGSLEGLDSEKQDKVKEGFKWGDRSRSYAVLPGYKKVDAFFDRVPLKLDRISPLIARTMTDGDWLRAIVGTFSLFLYAFAIFAGAAAALSVNSQALPPSWKWVVILALIGVFDSFAGLLASIHYFGIILLHGNINSLSALLTMVGMISLFFGPALIAAAVRPFRRFPEGNKHDKWEWIMDMTLGPLIGGWVASKIISSFVGFAKIQLPIAYHAGQIGIIVGVGILIRMLLEDMAVNGYPNRLNDVTSEFEDPYLLQRLISLAIKGGIFYFLSGQFIGFNIFLVAGTVLFVIPSLIDILVGEKLPKSEKLNFWLPTGTVLGITLVFLGAFAETYVQTKFTSTLAFFRVAFVATLIPVVLFQIGDLFIVEPPKSKHWSRQSNLQTYTYRLGCVIVFAVFALIVFGVDLPGKVSSFFGA